jgi:hypothetical protein
MAKIMKRMPRVQQEAVVAPQEVKVEEKKAEAN